MAKLYFRWSTVSSGKTAFLSISVHNDRLAGRHVIVLKIARDTRWDPTKIQSRVPGLEVTVDAQVCFPGDIITAVRAAQRVGPLDFIYIDEIQFATRDQVEILRDIATFEGVPVITYGLRTDWKLQLFEGSSSMFALADEFQEIKIMCSAWGQRCRRKTFANAKHHDRQPVVDDQQVEVGAEELYCGMCYRHYSEFNDRCLRIPG